MTWRPIVTIVVAFLVAGQAAAAAGNATPDEAPATVVLSRIDAEIASGNLATAEALIERNVAAIPAARIALARADHALAAGNIDAARAAFLLLTSDATVAARAYQGIGLADLGLGDDASALTALTAALVLEPRLIKAWIARGILADRARDWARADDAYAHALALDPRSATTFANRGYSKLLRGRFAEAADDSMLALAIDPKLATASNNLRMARAMSGDYKAAFVGSTKLTHARDLNSVGFAAMSRGDYAVAEAYFTRAMESNPQFDKMAWDNLIYLKQRIHRQIPVAGRQ